MALRNVSAVSAAAAPSASSSPTIMPPDVNAPAVPKQAMAVMPKMTAKVMPVASMATPALWRFFALVRIFSMAVGSGFFAKKLRAQSVIPLALALLLASSARFWYSCFPA